MQTVAVGQDTAPSVLVWPEVSPLWGVATFVFVVRWIVHARPFQRSASVEPLARSLTTAKEPPTAVHATAEAHETPLKKLGSPPLGRGVRCSNHREPFQRSINGRCKRPVPADPTAKHAVGDAHDTALSDALGLGVGSIVHRDPFRRSTSTRL